MKKWIWSSITLFCLCFVLGNAYLLQKYEDDVHRVVSVEEFTKPMEGDIRNLIHKEGVVTSSSEQIVSYSRELGMIDEVFVKEGDQVHVGSQLFEYQSADLDRLKLQLELKRDIAEAEVSKVRKDIIALNSIKSPSSTTLTDEQKDAAEANALVIKSQVSELELREALLELDIEDYDNQLELIETEEASKIVQSSIEGIVKNVNLSNQNEMITILGYPFVVQGHLSENDSKAVKVGQKVYITEGNQRIEGTIDRISQFPIDTPSLEKESLFPFTVVVTEIEVEQLPFGHHLGMAIVEAESENTTLVQTKSVFRLDDGKGKLFVANNGKLKEVKVELGLIEEKKLEILDGLQGTELLVLEPTNKMKNGIPFVLPLQELKLNKNELDEMGKRRVASTILKGLVGID
jgi:multidrug efflux pump subunit AcrA (membrane-fusion protein)